MGNINTLSESLIFLPTLQNKKRGCQIKVQPPLISRRKLLITSGSKRIQGGIPAVDMNKKTKQKNQGTWYTW